MIHDIGKALNFENPGDGKAAFQAIMQKEKQVVTIFENYCRDIAILTTVKEKPAYFHFDLSILSLQILKILVKDFAVPKAISLQESLFIIDRLQTITDYLEKNYQHSISLDELAMYMYLSKEYLSRFFKQHMRLTIGEYLRNVRAQSAYKDILNTSETLTNIALANGFSGLRSMNRALESRYSLSASQIRKNNQK